MQKIKATILSTESIELFRRSLSARARSTHTVKAYCTDLKVFLLNLGEPTVNLETEYEDLGMAWLTANRRVLAPRTTARRLTSLRAFAAWAGYSDMLTDYDPPDGGTPQPHPIPEGMDGVRRLIEVAANERQKALVALCGMVGLRLGEALSVTWDSFTFQGGAMLTVRGKGDVTRRVPVSEEAMTHLLVPIARVMGTETPIVNLSDRFARRMVSQLGVKAKLMRRIASHDLRATFATAVYNKTKDQRLVQMLLGHKSGRTTEIYIGVAMSQMREGVEKL